MDQVFSHCFYSYDIPLEKLLDILNKFQTYMLGPRLPRDITILEYLWGKNADLTKDITIFKSAAGEVIGFTGFALLSNNINRLIAMFDPEYFNTSLPQKIMDTAFENAIQACPGWWIFFIRALQNRDFFFQKKP